MNVELHASTAGAAKIAPTAPRVNIVISRWVNERLPPWDELLTAHDVARLTRRHHLILSALTLVGCFPRKLRFQGRGIGWHRRDVARWLNRGTGIEADAEAPEEISSFPFPFPPSGACAPRRHKSPRRTAGTKCAPRRRSTPSTARPPLTDARPDSEGNRPGGVRNEF